MSLTVEFRCGVVEHRVEFFFRLTLSRAWNAKLFRRVHGLRTKAVRETHRGRRERSNRSYPHTGAKNNGALKPRLKAHSKMGLRHALHAFQKVRVASSFQRGRGNCLFQ